VKPEARFPGEEHAGTRDRVGVKSCILVRGGEPGLGRRPVLGTDRASRLRSPRRRPVAQASRGRMVPAAPMARAASQLPLPQRCACRSPRPRCVGPNCQPFPTSRARSKNRPVDPGRSPTRANRRGSTCNASSRKKTTFPWEIPCFIFASFTIFLHNLVRVAPTTAWCPNLTFRDLKVSAGKLRLEPSANLGFLPPERTLSN
jgi:hypothetical protein